MLDSVGKMTEDTQYQPQAEPAPMDTQVRWLNIQYQPQAEPAPINTQVR